MKKVVSGNELKLKMKEAIDLLCDTVKTTLGPIGSNVIINHSISSPFVTNDGVTIANNIESDDEVINTVLELAKESTIKTNETVGDGTTTTLVLLKNIYEEGEKLINNGMSPILLKKELDNLKDIILRELDNTKRKPTNSELHNIACISSNDESIGSIVYEAFSKIKDKNFINIVERGEETYVNYIKGYIFDTVLASPYFLEQKELTYEKPYVLLSNSIIYDIESLSSVLNYIHEKNLSLVIIAEDYDDAFVNEILSLVINEDYKIVLLKLPLYGRRKLNLLKDIECISLSKINYESYNIDSLGIVKRIVIDKDNTRIDFEHNDMVRDRLIELKNELNKEPDEYEKDFYKKRIAMLKNKMAEIVVGAPTNAERKEKRMRFEDALCAISSAYFGISIGSGVTLYEISDKIDNSVLSNALKKPLLQILYNAGVDVDKIVSEIVNSNYKKIYNVNTGFEEVEKTSVLDPTLVLKESIINSISTAGMLLSVTSLVINENNVSNNTSYDNL